MSTGKTSHRDQSAGTSATVPQPHIAPTEKHFGWKQEGDTAGTQRLASSASTPNPNGMGTPARARIANTMQRNVGNARISRMTIQRKCACGGDAGPDGECAECKAKRLALQRQAKGPDARQELPESVHAALNSSSGQPFDKGIPA